MRLRSIVLPVIAMFGLVPAARAGELDQARLRGSSAYDAAPRYLIPASEPVDAAPAPPPYPAAGSRAHAVAPPVAELHNFTFALGSRFWYSTGTLAKELYDDPRSSQNLNSRLTYAGLTSG